MSTSAYQQQAAPLHGPDLPLNSPFAPFLGTTLRGSPGPLLSVKGATSPVAPGVFTIPSSIFLASFPSKQHRTSAPVDGPHPHRSQRKPRSKSRKSRGDQSPAIRIQPRRNSPRPPQPRSRHNPGAGSPGPASALPCCKASVSPLSRSVASEPPSASPHFWLPAASILPSSGFMPIPSASP